MLAIGGQVKRNDLLRMTHQAVDNASLLRSSTKYSAEVQDPESLSGSNDKRYSCDFR